jgi:tRNA dimethylallyltransferase
VATYQAVLPFTAVGMDPGDQLAARVRQRLSDMLSAGLLEEIARLGDSLGPTAAEAVGYKQLLPVVTGVVSAERGFHAAIRATMRLAKRQRTYFRRDPRIKWVPWSSDPNERYERVKRSLEET